MEFETRLEELHKGRLVPVHETDAAVIIYERMVTARSICVSLFGAGASDVAVSAVMAELSSEARFIMLNDERLLAEGSAD